MSRSFDLIVIGTGVAGRVVANECRQAGLNVAVVDSRPYGGTCALRGCDPKKVLVGAAEAVDFVGRMEGKGVRSGGAGIDWGALARHKRSFVESVPEHMEKSFALAGIETFHGRARFIGRTSLQVSEDILEAHHICIASGAMPADLRVAGQEHLVTSDGFLDLGELPRRVLFLGSGYIAFEFAHVSAMAGAQVTMLEMLDRPLAGFDPDLVSVLVERTCKMGVELHLENKVEKIERSRDGLVVHASNKEGSRTFEADLVVHSAGRAPEIDDLDLEQGGVEREKRGVRVNEYLQSVSNPAVYAAGDAAASGPMLTPVAAYEGHTVAANLLHGNTQKIDYPSVPSVVFTLPPLASVGMQDADAKAQGDKVKAKFERTDQWYSSRRVGEEFSAYKVLVEEESGRILGSHLLGPHADEVINLFALAMRAGMTSSDLKKTILAYPTVGSDLPYML